MFAGQEKLQLGLERLARAGDDADMLGTALTSVHGALEDRFRQILASTPGVHESEHARILDVSRVQWNELIDLMRLYQGLTIDDAALVRRMNRERQAVAHGERYRGGRSSLQRYAAFVSAYFPGVEAPPEQAKPAARKRPAKPASSAPTARKSSSRPAKPTAQTRSATTAKPGMPARKQPARPTPKQRRSPQRSGRVTLVMGVLALVLLSLACVGLSNMVTSTGAMLRPLSAPQAPDAGRVQVTTEALYLRSKPGLESLVVTTIPAESSVELQGARERVGEREWAAVRYNRLDGWVDTQFLRAP
ncbi:MAG TPA: SH3 domain-containing protein [Roseiflexaceae bacterium]|nr:SH3 domain-containing protein [Roseiflexaceae bacterium]